MGQMHNPVLYKICSGTQPWKKKHKFQSKYDNILIIKYIIINYQHFKINKALNNLSN